MLDTIWAAAGGLADPAPDVIGEGALPSAFAVTRLASDAIGAAGMAVAEWIAEASGRRPAVVVDRRLSSFWFGVSVQPQGWALPPIWDAVAGDYQTADGWIRLHTNAPHHRKAALAVLDTEPERERVAAAVRGWQADALEAAIVGRGGCAATMRSMAAWAAHPQGGAVAAEPLLWRLPTAGSRPHGAVDPARPLTGLRVLDLTRVLAGPVATRFLAGFGADVLRIDPPGWDEPAVEADMTLGKRCARLDLRTPDGRAALCALLSQADVFVHGYRPGALDALGLGAVERQRLRPGLVDVCLDAYGWTGPWAGRRGFDSLVQMSSGIAAFGMAAFGRNRPTPLPVQALDHATGYIMAAAVIRGLTERRRTGAGCQVRASLARTASLLVSAPAGPASPALGRPEERDFDPAIEATAIEATAWGPARRLRPPVAVEGAPMRWDRPAGPLGSAEAAWRSG